MIFYHAVSHMLVCYWYHIVANIVLCLSQTQIIMDHTTWGYTTHVNKSLVRYYIISPYTTSYHLTISFTMLNILVWLIMILDILILVDNRLRHTTLYLMVLDCILSYGACVWLSATSSLHITSHQDVYCTMPA